MANTRPQKILNTEELDNYTKWRDEFLVYIVNDLCKPCTKQQKENLKVSLSNPLSCECQCEEVKRLLTTAKNLDASIQYTLSHQ